jgi:hypothetical protein
MLFRLDFRLDEPLAIVGVEFVAIELIAILWGFMRFLLRGRKCDSFSRVAIDEIFTPTLAVFRRDGLAFRPRGVLETGMVRSVPPVLIR